MDIIVRKYEDKDYLSVSNLIEKCFSYKKEKVKYDAAHEFVAVLEDNVVGYFILNEMFDIIKNKKIYHVDYVCVDPDYQGKGIGHIMMNYVLDYAKENGVKKLELTSSYKRVAAHKLYSSMGFKIRDTAVFVKELE